MWVIKVTSLDGNPIYINVDKIGYFYEVEETRFEEKIVKLKYTKIGGFEVKETASELAKLIINAGNTLSSIIKE
jgi:hypothetical protein